MIFRILILLMFSKVCYGQYISTLDFNGELSQNTVIALEKDTAGFLWLGTADGLNRFDGRDVKVFRNNRLDSISICGNEIMDIKLDSSNNLWIGTGTGLSMLDLSTYTFYNYNADSSALLSNYILDIEILDNVVFILTPKGINTFDIHKNRFSSAFEKLTLPVEQIAKYDLGGLLFLSDNSIYNYNQQHSDKLFDLNKIRSHNLKVQKIFSHQNLICVAFSSELIVYDTEQDIVHKFTDFKFNETRNVIYWNDQIWFNTSKGLITYDCLTQDFVKQSEKRMPNGVAIESVVLSTDELLVSIGNEVVIISKNEPLFETIDIDNGKNNNFGSNKIWHICNDEEEMIISTERGIKVFYSNDKVINLSDLIPYAPDKLFASNVIRDSSNIWISTFDEGFYHLDLTKDKVKNYSSSNEPPFYIANNTVRHSMQTDSLVYLSTDSGLYVFDKSTRSVNMISLTHATNTENRIKVSCTILDSKNKLWIGTQDGLYRQKTEGKFDFYSKSTETSLSHNRVRSLKLYQDSILLVGTSAGLNYLNTKHSSNKIVDSQLGLVNDVIYSIEIDNDDDIWVSTNTGISMIDTDYNVVNYNIHDGLQENEFNTNSSTVGTDNKFYFGGVNGISKFDPLMVKSTVSDNKPIITEIEILPHNETKGFVYSYPLDSSYHFNYEECNFVIRFSNINFLNPENDHFEYRLLGYNHNWVKVTDRLEAQFMNLKKGEYAFELKGTNRKGRTNNYVQKMKITIDPPYYYSNWFKLLVLSIFAGIVCLIYWIRHKQLEESNRLKEEFLKQIPEPLVIYDKEKNIILANSLFEELRKKHIEMNGSKNGVFQFLEQTISEGIDQLISQKKDNHIFTKSFNETHFELKFSELVLNHAKFGIAVLVRDITSVRKAISLSKSEELFRSYFEKSPMGIIYIEASAQTIINCNHKFCQIVKMTKDEVLQKNVLDLTHPDDLSEDLKTYHSARSNQLNYLLRPNKRWVSKGGHTAITETHTTFIYNEKGEYQYMFALIHDVTEQRENQKKLIEVKTKLIQSEKLASLGQIIAGVAHEINNPVNFIYNGVNNLKRLIDVLQNHKAEDKEVIYQDIQQMIEAIDDGAKRTTEIVKSLRMFTKEDVKSKTDFNVIDGLESTLLLLSHRIKDKIRVEKSFPFSGLMVNCYPNQLNQVFMNVLTNAIEAIDGIGTIWVSAKTTQSDAIFEIKDSGVGISPELFTKIFEPFYSTKGAKNGIGLGLSISHTIIEKHNGSISISANQPRGTIVLIKLPLQ